MNRYLKIILILFLIYKFNKIENFDELYLENYSKLNLDNEIRIIIDNIKMVFEKNGYFSSRFKTDQFLLLLDSIIEDYNSFLKKNCSLQNITKYITQSELNTMKSELILFFKNELDFVSNNYKNLIEIEIIKFIDIIFNEYIFNCF
jgi:hypothetical protein